MVTPDKNYRINPNRTVYIVGAFDDDLLKIAIPKITELRYENNDPVSIIINSTGGNADCLEALIAALSVSDPDGNESRVITSVVGEAASAGAILLASADYAIATHSSVIHFHGIRLSEYEVTTESATQIANRLSRQNKSIADEMARAMMPRIVHRYLRLKADIDDYKKKQRTPKLAPALAFVDLAADRVISNTAKRIFSETVERLVRVRHLSISAGTIKFGRKETDLQKDSKLLKHIIDFEIKDKNAPLTHLDEHGARRVFSDYMMIRDFTFGDHMFFLDDLISSCGPEFLKEKEMRNYRKLKLKSSKAAYRFLVDKTYLPVQDFWYLTVSIARALLRGENRLTATDAYWLGAIDEITGDPDAYGIRMINEKEIEPEAKPRSVKKKTTAS